MNIRITCAEQWKSGACFLLICGLLGLVPTLAQEGTEQLLARRTAALQAQVRTLDSQVTSLTQRIPVVEQEIERLSEAVASVKVPDPEEEEEPKPKRKARQVPFRPPLEREVSKSCADRTDLPERSSGHPGHRPIQRAFQGPGGKRSATVETHRLEAGDRSRRRFRCPGHARRAWHQRHDWDAVGTEARRLRIHAERGIAPHVTPFPTARPAESGVGRHSVRGLPG